jgi:molecular chaperone HtpG
VADRVTVTTRRAGLSEDEGVRWESDGQGEYTVQTIRRKKRGTEVLLHLRDEHKEYLNGWKLRQVIRKYSDHITLPIQMPKEGEKEKGYETVNSATALWARNKKDITEEDYNEFYKHVAHDFEPPLARVHTKTEGKLEYTTLFFIPARAPFDLWDREARHGGVKLYVRRIFIMDDAEQLLPRYLRFVRGIIDTSDLPLNISREILQRNKVIDTIRAASVKKILGLLESLSAVDYEKFWKEFGRVIKEGIVDDADNRISIAKLLRYPSTREDSAEKLASLADYISRMSAEQEAIYYLSADSFATAKNSPHLEVFRKKGIEVLLLCDPIDEWVATYLTEFEGKPLKSVAKGALDLGKLADKEEQKKETREVKDLLGRLRGALAKEVGDVRATNRLTTSPACLVADDHGMSANLERILKQVGQKIEGSKPVLEINAEHGLVKRLGEETDEARFNDWAHILFDQALLAEGGRLEDPAGFVRRMNEMFLAMSSASSA